jgi:hypothetical protein
MNMNRSRIQTFVGITLVAVSWSAWGGVFNFSSSGSGSGSNSAAAIPNTQVRPTTVYSSGRDTVVVPSRNPTGGTWQPYTVLTPTGRYLMVPGPDGQITNIIEVSRTRD